ncbi:MAG: SH3 domain-containing protein [Syntrophomonadaceae bacterium]|nr:SH3 domain-containing protein [Syntrophomonadaceae bacterium]
MIKRISAIIVLAVFGVFLCTYNPGVAGEFTAANVKQVQVTANNLHLRTGAGTNHTIITTLHKGNVLEVLGKIDDWYVVKMTDDTVGCVVTRYVKSYNPAPVTNPSDTSSATAMQTEMLGYINKARTDANLAPLKLDKALCDGALLKSQDMVNNNYFNHQSPKYGSPFEMMGKLGIKYNYAGENIAKHLTVKSAHEGFMNSSGHRANILGANYGKVGLGFVKSGGYLYVTQWFTN